MNAQSCVNLYKYPLPNYPSVIRLYLLYNKIRKSFSRNMKMYTYFGMGSSESRWNEDIRWNLYYTLFYVKHMAKYPMDWFNNMLETQTNNK